MIQHAGDNLSTCLVPCDKISFSAAYPTTCLVEPIRFGSLGLGGFSEMGHDARLPKILLSDGRCPCLYRRWRNDLSVGITEVSALILNLRYSMNRGTISHIHVQHRYRLELASHVRTKQ